MKAEFTAQDHAQLKAWNITPDLGLTLSPREASLLIRQLQLDLNATEAELKVLQSRDLTCDGLKQAYRNLDEQCSKMTRLLEKAEKAIITGRRKYRAWKASAISLACGALLWHFTPELWAFALAWWNG